mmetsp:Transcript_13121/g.29144  ORF Transcript_13121/g.29144 Transcript_13121/m.29144 type:complete len:509 (-) Transcript_13121:176-1702(-)
MRSPKVLCWICFLSPLDAVNQVHLEYRGIDLEHDDDPDTVGLSVADVGDAFEHDSSLLQEAPGELRTLQACRAVVAKLPKQVVLGVGVGLADGVVRASSVMLLTLGLATGAVAPLAAGGALHVAGTAIGSEAESAGVAMAELDSGANSTFEPLATAALFGLGLNLAGFAGAYGVIQGLRAGAPLYNSVAYGRSRPRCCCPVDMPLGQGCAVTPLQCPKGQTQVRGACSILEIVNYEGTTVRGCQCQHGAPDCTRNALHDGHAWCYVTGPGSCGRKSAWGIGSRWDFCSISGAPLPAVNTGNVPQLEGATNDALAAFMPNERARYQRFVDVSLGLAYNPANGRCLLPTVVDTLAECAELCLHRNVTYLSSRGEGTGGECAGFAYDHRNHRCLLLPMERVNQRFEPVSSNLHHPDGWQNFILRYKATVGSGSWFFRDHPCAAEQLEAIADAGFKIVRNKNSGRGYLATPCGSQKFSCRPSDCNGEDWCFVPNQCGSVINPCWRLANYTCE